VAVLKLVRAAPWALATLVSLHVARAASAQAAPSRAPAGTPQGEHAALEYEVKAAYLFNFTRYVDWPDDAFDSPTAPIVIGIFGHDPFGPTLTRTLDGRTSHDRPIEIRYLDGTADARGCHLIFVSRDEWRRRPELVGALRRRGLLLVGEGDDFAQAGGTLAFVSDAETVHFAVNLDARDAAGLRLSSRMLALATGIHGRGGAR
jgi:hypothetical protein